MRCHVCRWSSILDLFDEQTLAIVRNSAAASLHEPGNGKLATLSRYDEALNRDEENMPSIISPYRKEAQSALKTRL